jgi:hypothetical protein
MGIYLKTLLWGQFGQQACWGKDDFNLTINDNGIKLKLNNVSYLPRMRTIELQMHRGAVISGSIALLLAIGQKWLQSHAWARGGYIIFQIALIASACISYCRYQEVTRHISFVKDWFHRSADLIEEVRARVFKDHGQHCFSLEEYPGKYFSPVEVEKLYNARVFHWVESLAKEAVDTLEGKKKWMQRFFGENCPLRAACFNAYLHSSTSYPAYYAVQVEKIAKSYSDFANARCAEGSGQWISASKEECNQRQTLWEKFTKSVLEKRGELIPITNAFTHCLGLLKQSVKVSLWRQEKEDDLREYKSLALKAAIGSSREFHEGWQKARDCVANPFETDFTLARQFIEDVKNYFQGKGALPQIPKILYWGGLLPMEYDIPKLHIELNDRFYQLAKEQTPDRGTKEEHLAFIDEIKQRGAFKQFLET